MAREQDRETDRLAIQAETESQRRQMLRCVDVQSIMSVAVKSFRGR